MMVGTSGDSNIGVVRTRTYKSILHYRGLELIRDNGEELEKHVKRNIILITEWFQDEILVLSQNADEETNIKLRMKYIDLMKFVFESDNCGFYNERIYRAYFNIALSYAKLGDVENTIDNCIKCIESAILFENYDKVKLNSLLLDGVVVDKNKTTSNMAISTYQHMIGFLQNILILSEITLDMLKLKNY